MASPFEGLTLQNKAGETVDAATALKGKAVALFFSSAWCPMCTPFVPELETAYEFANSEEEIFEVVFVTSDDSEEKCSEYMKAKHGDWLRVAYADRQVLKQKYGCFAGREQDDFKDTKRRNGIPGVVVVGPDGAEVTPLADGPDWLAGSGLSKGSLEEVKKWPKF
eukprot:TRINITY_DN2602_c0_g4_i1.p1 TRINITY_DN2602_c0_g4~~TRINITY_DN2602_c0_g4_i1.p1  ORF type:complete len:188 (+),score=66.88 TRINITY_DN2602_c0_g4_i1:72-566(+)